tara:strand:+ start:907 stop:1326 length:420 start_codon:yes stop_codon:yes gene_type:complete
MNKGSQITPEGRQILANDLPILQNLSVSGVIWEPLFDSKLNNLDSPASRILIEKIRESTSLGNSGETGRSIFGHDFEFLGILLGTVFREGYLLSGDFSFRNYREVSRESDWSWYIRHFFVIILKFLVDTSRVAISPMKS